MGLTNSVTEALIRWKSILQSKLKYKKYRSINPDAIIVSSQHNPLHQA